jgi:hypothetical protein
MAGDMNSYYLTLQQLQVSAHQQEKNGPKKFVLCAPCFWNLELLHTIAFFSFQASTFNTIPEFGSVGF